jgi:YidC/Oxa1 family membrane protein insertase
MTLVYANIFQPLIDVFESVLVFFHDHVVTSWGLSIILLTVVVRAALIPLTLRQFRSMQALQRLQPEIKALQARYKDDKQRLNQEMMKFYQENKVNPLGSCLPLLLQMPVFLALYFMLRVDLKKNICPALTDYAHSIHKAVANVSCSQVPDTFTYQGQVHHQHLAHAGKFLFIPDLTHKATGAVLITLIVLYVASQLGSSLLMSVTADKTQQRIMILLPLIFVTFIIQFPAGLIVYWITTNLWTIVQQYIVRRRVGHIGAPAPATAAPAGARAAVATSGAGGGGGSEKPAASPPPPPRKKKKRSGRRR